MDFISRFVRKERNKVNGTGTKNWISMAEHIVHAALSAAVTGFASASFSYQLFIDSLSAISVFRRSYLSLSLLFLSANNSNAQEEECGVRKILVFPRDERNDRPFIKILHRNSKIVISLASYQS